MKLPFFKDCGIPPWSRLELPDLHRPSHYSCARHMQVILGVKISKIKFSTYAHMHICTYAGDLQISKKNFFFRSKWFSLPASATCATSLLAPSSQTSLSLSVSLLLLITSLARRYQGLILIMMVLVMMITMLTKHLQHKQRALVHLSQPVPNLLWHRYLCLWGLKIY